MKYTSDRDGKSKTASGVDGEHYPEQNEVDNFGSEADPFPNHDEIAERAFQLWQARGCPEGSAQQDWVKAEAELQAEAAARSTAQSTASGRGSIQR